MAKKQGKIKAIPVKEVIKGMQVTYNDVVYVVVKCQSNSNDLIIRRINATNLVDITNLNINLKTLVVEYDIDHGAITIPQQIPLKQSQWQAAINNKEVDTDKVVTFEINSSPKGNFSYAKIIPNKQTNNVTVDQSVIDNIIKYCEDKAIYDKLSNYGDFYYKLKNISK